MITTTTTNGDESLPEITETVKQGEDEEEEVTSELLEQRLQSVIGWERTLNRDLVLNTPLNTGTHVTRMNHEKVVYMCDILDTSDHWNAAMTFNWNAICPNGISLVVRGGQDGSFEMTPTAWFQRFILDTDWTEFAKNIYINCKRQGEISWTYGPSVSDPNVIIPIALHPRNYDLYISKDRNGADHYVPSPRDLPSTPTGVFNKHKQLMQQSQLPGSMPPPHRHHMIHDLNSELGANIAPRYGQFSGDGTSLHATTTATDVTSVHRDTTPSTKWTHNIPKFLAADTHVLSPPRSSDGSPTGDGWKAIRTILDLEKLTEDIHSIIERQAHRPFLATSARSSFTEESAAMEILKAGRPVSIGNLTNSGPSISPLYSPRAPANAIPMPAGSVDMLGIPTRQYAEDLLGLTTWEYNVRQTASFQTMHALTQKSLDESSVEYVAHQKPRRTFDLRLNSVVDKKLENPLVSGAVSYVPCGVDVTNVKLPEISQAHIEQADRLEKRIMAIANAPFEILGGTAGSRVATADLTKFAVNMPIQNWRDTIAHVLEKAYWRIYGTGIITPFVWVAMKQGITVTDDHIRDTINDLNIRFMFRDAPRTVSAEHAINLQERGYVTPGFVEARLAAQYDIPPSCILPGNQKRLSSEITPDPGTDLAGDGDDGDIAFAPLSKRPERDFELPSVTKLGGGGPASDQHFIPPQ